MIRYLDNSFKMADREKLDYSDKVSFYDCDCNRVIVIVLQYNYYNQNIVNFIVYNILFLVIVE